MGTHLNAFWLIWFQMQLSHIKMTEITRISRRGKATPTYSRNPFIEETIAGTKPKMRRIANTGNRLMIVAENGGDYLV